MRLPRRALVAPAARGAVWTWGYARVSTKKQERNGFSLEDQQRLVRARAAIDGFSAIPPERMICDRGESAYEGDCPGFLGMLDAIRASGRAAVVFLLDLDRLARNVGYQNAAFTELAALGARLVVVNQPNLDVTTAAGKFTANVLGSVNQHFSDRLSERMKTAVAGSYERGKWPHQWPAGWLADPASPGIGRIDPVQGPLMRELFSRVAKGEPLQPVHRALQRRGLKASRTRAYELLVHPIYAGFNALPDGREVAGLWEPIVTRNVWDRVQARLQQRDADPDKRQYTKDSDTFPLKRSLTCDACGGTMTGDASMRGKNEKLRKMRAYYDCRSRAERRTPRCVRCPPELLHDTFLDLLKRITLIEPFTRDAIVSKWRADQEETRELRRQAERRLTELEKDEQANVSAFERAATSAAMTAALTRRGEDLAAQREATATRIQELNAKLCESEEEIAELVSFVTERIERLDVTWRDAPLAARQALQKFVFPAGLRVALVAEGTLKFRTPVTAPIFGLFPRSAPRVSEMASPAGVEPASPP